MESQQELGYDGLQALATQFCSRFWGRAEGETSIDCFPPLDCWGVTWGSRVFRCQLCGVRGGWHKRLERVPGGGWWRCKWSETVLSRWPKLGAELHGIRTVRDRRGNHLKSRAPQSNSLRLKTSWGAKKRTRSGGLGSRFSIRKELDELQRGQWTWTMKDLEFYAENLIEGDTII